MGSVGMACMVLVIVAMSISGAISAAIHGEAHGQPEVGHYLHLAKRSAERGAASSNPQKLCGHRLVEALRNVCGRAFFTHPRRSGSSTGGYKMEESGDGYDGLSYSFDLGFDPVSTQYGTSGDSYWDKDTDNLASDLELMWPHNPKSLALKVLTEGTAHNRVRRNIVEDCCHRACTIKQMRQYCAMSG